MPNVDQSVHRSSTATRNNTQPLPRPNASESSTTENVGMSSLPRTPPGSNPRLSSRHLNAANAPVGRVTFGTAHANQYMKSNRVSQSFLSAILTGASNTATGAFKGIASLSKTILLTLSKMAKAVGLKVVLPTVILTSVAAAAEHLANNSNLILDHVSEYAVEAFNYIKDTVPELFNTVGDWFKEDLAHWLTDIAPDFIKEAWAEVLTELGLEALSAVSCIGVVVSVAMNAATMLRGSIFTGFSAESISDAIKTLKNDEVAQFTTTKEGNIQLNFTLQGEKSQNTNLFTINMRQSYKLGDLVADTNIAMANNTEISTLVKKLNATPAPSESEKKELTTELDEKVTKVMKDTLVNKMNRTQNSRKRSAAISAMASGAGLGAAIGTFIFPGIGTGFGAAIGLAIGGLIGYGESKLLQNTNENQVKQVKALFGEFTEEYDISNIEKKKGHIAGEPSRFLTPEDTVSFFSKDREIRRIMSDD